MENPFKVGDAVYRNYPFDGTPKQGYPDMSRVFHITKIEDWAALDGVVEEGVICHLTPGATWSHWRHLTKV